MQLSGILIFFPGCLLFFVISNLVSGLPYQPEPYEKTFFKPVGLIQFDDFGDVQGFSHFTAPDTAYVVWSFLAVISTPSEKCVTKVAHIHLRHGSFPFIVENNKTYPEDFILQSSSSYSIDIDTNGTNENIEIQNPLHGTWYAAGYLDKTDSESVGKITDVDCNYDLQINVTRYPIDSIPVLSKHIHDTFNKEIYYKFFIEDNVYKYSVLVAECHQGNKSLSPCPVDVFLRGCALPDRSADTHAISCRALANSSECELTITSPEVMCWHYLVIENRLDTDNRFNSDINLSVKLDQAVCEPKKIHRSRREVTITQFDSIEKNSNDNSTVIHFKPLQPSKHCSNVHKLSRIESPNSPMLNDFTFQSIDGRASKFLDAINVTENSVSMVKFELLPTKDIGATLNILVEIRQYQFLREPAHQNMTFLICIQHGRIPTNGSQLLCSGVLEEMHAELAHFKDPAFLKHFAFPDPGLWFIGAELRCFNSTTGDPENCLQKSVLAEFQVFTAPCNEGSCENGGICRQVLQGGLLQSYCSCPANYRGFTCGDDSQASSKDSQLLFTLLLTLSNLCFLPAIFLASYRHYYTEAMVYFANMFFSAFYHACDQDSFSLYKLCILPYHPLQYADFFLSILSFWVTLLVVSSIQQPWRSLLEMLGAVIVAVMVEWQEHNLIVNLVPICAGVAIVFLTWIVKSIRGKQCFPAKKRLLCFLPGFSLAGLGLCIFGFLETDDNYAYTHSAWHACVSLSIIFLLPKKTIHVIEEPISDSYELGLSDQNPLINALDPDDLNL